MTADAEIGKYFVSHPHTPSSRRGRGLVTLGKKLGPSDNPWRNLCPNQITALAVIRLAYHRNANVSILAVQIWIPHATLLTTQFLALLSCTSACPKSLASQAVGPKSPDPFRSICIQYLSTCNLRLPHNFPQNLLTWHRVFLENERCRS